MSAAWFDFCECCHQYAAVGTCWDDGPAWACAACLYAEPEEAELMLLEAMDNEPHHSIDPIAAAAAADEG